MYFINSTRAYRFYLHIYLIIYDSGNSKPISMSLINVIRDTGKRGAGKNTEKKLLPHCR